MDNSKYDKLIQKSIKTYNKLRNNKKVKDYEIVTKIVESISEKQPKREYYKSDDKYDYYIELPFKKLVIDNDKGAFYQNESYNCVYCEKGKNIEGKSIPYEYDFCLGLSNLTRQEIEQEIDLFIKYKNNDLKEIEEN